VYRGGAYSFLNSFAEIGRKNPGVFSSPFCFLLEVAVEQKLRAKPFKELNFGWV
jgi:hypothetical protein